MNILLFLSLAIAGTATPEPNAVAGEVQSGGQQQGAATLQTASQSATPATERQICRRQARIGTLAGYESSATPNRMACHRRRHPGLLPAIAGHTRLHERPYGPRKPPAAAALAAAWKR